jgi:diguanylate cyclase (GGDEF)-like protein
MARDFHLVKTHPHRAHTKVYAFQTKGFASQAHSADKSFKGPLHRGHRILIMKRSISALSILLCWAMAAWSAAPATLTSLHAVHSLNHAQAAKQPPSVFEATVTYRRAGETTMFVQEAGEGLYVWADAKIKLAPGDRILVRGHAGDSFRPIVIADSATLLHHGAPPEPVPATFDDLIRARRDCARVAVRATVRSADVGLDTDTNNTHLVLLVDGSTIDAYLDNGALEPLNGLLDAEVEVYGVAESKFDGKMQQVGAALSIPSIDDVKILNRAAANPWSLPVTEMDATLPFYHPVSQTRRVHVQGIVTYYQPGSAVVLQQGTKSIWIQTAFQQPLRVGSWADVTGFPDVHNNFLTLANGEIHQGGDYAPIAPQPVTRRELTSSKHIFDLVSIEGQVVMEVRESSQDQYVLTADGEVFSAIYRHPDVAGLGPLPKNEVPLGSKVRVVGISIMEGSNPWGHEVPFDILMRAPEDISVVASPSLLNIRNLVLLVVLLLVCIVVVGARSLFFQQKVRRETVALAYIEGRRSRILEGINGSRPLAEVIEQITELASFKLKGAPCWCRIVAGAQLGNCPPKLESFRVIQVEIPAHSAPPLGTVYAAFDPLSKPRPFESDAIFMAAALASLAIETRRLYTDLRRRSEFDLLTDTHNRFSLDKRLDSLIAEARDAAKVFGLIYIDLDKFKQINDLCGHHVGDRYLQEVALRMKKQLRSHDLLARIGGDEFAALVPVVRNRAEVEEIALRLERCLDDPFLIETFVVQGSASLGIALYPQDGDSNDTLLKTADAAMYKAKNSRRKSPFVPGRRNLD